MRLAGPRWGIVLLASLVIEAFTTRVATASEAVPQFVSAWGSSGPGPGQFNGPGQIATDANGYVYVADTGNHRVQRFTPSGVHFADWGTTGPAEQQLIGPVGIAFDAEGNCYVADQGQEAMMKFDSNGAFIERWPSATGPIAIDPDGYLYVAFGMYVRKYDFDGNILSNLQPLAQDWMRITGLAVDAAHNLHVVDYSNLRILVYRADGTLAATQSMPGATDLAFDPRGDSFVGLIDVSPGVGQLRRYNSQGGLLSAWASGSSSGSNTWRVAANGFGDLYVLKMSSTVGVSVWRYRIYQAPPCVGSCVLPSSSLCAWWPMESQTTYLAQDPPAIYETVVDPNMPYCPRVSGVPTIVPARVGNGMHFNSTNDWLVSRPPLWPTVFSIETWLRLDSGAGFGTRRVICSNLRKVGALIEGLEFFSRNRSLGLLLGDEVSSAEFQTPEGLFSEDEWHHVAVTVDIAQHEGAFYLDGLRVQSFTPYLGTPTGEENWRIARTSNPVFAPEPFRGALDEFSLYRTALDSSQVRKLWAAQAGGKCTGGVRVPAVVAFPWGTQTIGLAGGPLWSYFVGGISWRINGLKNLPVCLAASPPSIFDPADAGGGNVSTFVHRPAEVPGYSRRCYEVVPAMSTGARWSCATGVIQLLPRGLRATAAASLVVTPDAGLLPIHFTVHNDSSGAIQLNYGLSVLRADGDPLGTAVRIAGPAPLHSSPATVVVPALDSLEIEAWVDPGSAGAFVLDDIALVADLDGDGEEEVLSVISCVAPDSSGATTSVGAEGQAFDRPLAFGLARSPSRGPFTLELDGRIEGELRVTVHDVAGRVVSRPRPIARSATRREILWDARDGAGAECAPGVYFVLARDARASARATVVLIR